MILILFFWGTFALMALYFVLMFLVDYIPFGYEDASGFHYGWEHRTSNIEHRTPNDGEGKEFPPKHMAAVSGGASQAAERDPLTKVACEAPFNPTPGGIADTGHLGPQASRLRLPPGRRRSQEFSAREKSASSPHASSALVHSDADAAANRPALIPFGRPLNRRDGASRTAIEKRRAILRRILS